MGSQVTRPVDDVKKEEWEGEQGSGVEVDPLGGGGDDRFRRRGLLAVLGLWFSMPRAGVDGLAVAVEVRQLKVPGEGAHDAEVVGAQVWLGRADLLTAGLCHLRNTTKHTALLDPDKNALICSSEMTLAWQQPRGSVS